MAKATLNQNGIATTQGEMTVYNYDGDTREYLTSSVEFLSVGVGLPANSCADAPADKKDGYAVCRTASFDGWEYVADHRGEMVFDTRTGQPIEVMQPGDYPDNVTIIAPSTQYDEWNGSEWITDENALQQAQVLEAGQKKNALLAEAQNAIGLWQTELQLGIISDEDKASLIAWMGYIKELQAVKPENSPNIEWPVKPE